MRRHTFLLLAAAAAVVTACSPPLVPRSALSGSTHLKHSAIHARQTAGAGRSPYQYRRPILGVDLYALSNYPPAEVYADGVRTLAYIKNVLKADAVGIVWNFYSPGRESSLVKTTPDSLSASNVALLTKIAMQDHLQVEYRPLVMVMRHKKNPWEGLIHPPDPGLWFRQYFDAELPYLRVAQQLHIHEFVAATELHKMNSSPLWPSFFNRIRKIYHGIVSYAAWDGDYFPPTGRLLPVKLYGMDMYHALNLKYNASLAQVTSAWEGLFSDVPASIRERTALDEEGIEARRGAYKIPPNLGIVGRIDQQVQANWFIAACKTARRYHMRGVYFFKVDLTDYPATPATSLSTFEGKLGAVAISNCARLFR